MTCIAWDGRSLAADRLFCFGSMRNEGTKIHRIGDLLVGGSGETDFIGAMLEWVRGGRDPAAFPESQRSKDDYQPLLVIEADGTPALYERTPFPVRYEQRHVAIGSGREYARAAMHLGCSAEEAVKVAIALDPGCGYGVDVLVHRGAA